jgi:hypothetical protein
MMQKMAEQRPSVVVTPTVQWPSDAEVTVKNPVESVSVSNFGDVLKSLSLLGKGIDQLIKSVDLIELNIPNKAVQVVTGSVSTDVSTAELERQTADVAKAVKALAKEIKSQPATETEKITVDIPKSFTIDNLGDMQAGLRSINDNLVKLAAVVRESTPEAPEQDDSAVIKAVEGVENAIKGMVFPIPTPATPAFKDSNGAAVSAVLGSGGAIPMSSLPSGATAVNKYYSNTGAVTDGIVWSPAAGKRWYVTHLYFQTSADSTITFEDDLVAGDDPRLKGEFKAGSGLSAPYSVNNPLKSGEDAADLLVTTSAGNIYVTVAGYEL